MSAERPALDGWHRLSDVLDEVLLDVATRASACGSSPLALRWSGPQEISMEAKQARRFSAPLPDGQYALNGKVGQLRRSGQVYWFRCRNQDPKQFFEAEVRRSLLPSPVATVWCREEEGAAVRATVFQLSTWKMIRGAHLQGSGGLITNELRARQLIRHATVTGQLVTLVLNLDDGRQTLDVPATDLWLLALAGESPRIP